MEKRQKHPENIGILMALASAEVLLAAAEFAVNLYNLFYGLLFEGKRFPMLQTLAFIVSTPLYGLQLVCGGCCIVACVRVLCGHRNAAFFGGRFRECNLCVFTACAIYLLVMLFTWFIVVGELANPFIAQFGVWGGVHQAFQADVIGHLGMLGSVLVLGASMVVVLFVMWLTDSVWNSLKATKEEKTLLAHAKEPNSPPPSYNQVNTNTEITV
ncbi:uncharacterized protein LOC129597255 [Paramacrobiotus metropolitanus]|uniref:uncharacterized protein LOC129597255 n=1 Tax=Paramacrobiotus metropolitanus TaxID=2943436 RepID=UPI0024458550|nr:uncharacterized protein LOC129597255 [Paramacrobiotus metropolitanus]